MEAAMKQMAFVSRCTSPGVLVFDPLTSKDRQGGADFVNDQLLRAVQSC
jgi:hypothetical protein